MDKLVSVIIPTYNRPIYLERAINSVLNQTYKNIEVIVVDDNANNIKMQEETVRVIEKFRSCPNVKYIKNKYNVGGAESRNEGVKYSEAEYISFLDDDDEYEPNKISEQMNMLLLNQNVNICYCGMNYYNKENKCIGKRDIYVNGGEELIRTHIFRPITGTPALLLKRDTFNSIGGFDNLKRYQDANIIFKLLAHDFKIIALKKGLVRVYIHDNERISTNGNRFGLERDYIRNTLKYIDLLSYKNANRLIEKYHILNCFCNNKSYFSIMVNIVTKLKFRIFVKNNLFGILNYFKLLFLTKDKTSTK